MIYNVIVAQKAGILLITYTDFLKNPVPQRTRMSITIICNSICRLARYQSINKTDKYAAETNKKACRKHTQTLKVVENIWRSLGENGNNFNDFCLVINTNRLTHWLLKNSQHSELTGNLAAAAIFFSMFVSS